MSLADDLGLTEARIEPARSGEPTLACRGQSLLSAYAPAREAERLAAAIPHPRVRIVGLGLAYLAEALGLRLAGIVAAEGEELRLAQARPDAARKLSAAVELKSSLSDLERAVAGHGLRGEPLVVDPSWSAVPALKARIEDLIAMLAGRPRVTVIHLKTAGDVLRCLAAVQAYKKNFSHVELAFVTEKPYGELVALAPGIDAVIEVDPGAIAAPAVKRPFVAFNLGGDPVAADLLRSMNPLYASGYVRTETGVELRDDRSADRGAALNAIRNRMNRYALAFAIMGLPPAFDPPELTITASPKDYGVVQFGAGSGAEVWDPKRVDPRVIGEGIRRLGGRWIAVGSSGERDRARDGGIAEEDNFCGRTTWKELAELIAGARLYIGHDSGPTHVAAALGIPTLALFGFTSPILNAPVGPRTLVLQADMPCAYLGCRIPCPERTCTHQFDPALIVHAAAFLKSDSTREKLRLAHLMRESGMRFWTSALHADDADPLRGLMNEEPERGAPKIPSLALLRDWLRTTSR